MDVRAMTYLPEEYCDYCEDEGHTFRNCPARDDSPEPME